MSNFNVFSKKEFRWKILDSFVCWLQNLSEMIFFGFRVLPKKGSPLQIFNKKLMNFSSKFPKKTSDIYKVIIYSPRFSVIQSHKLSLFLNCWFIAV